MQAIVLCVVKSLMRTRQQGSLICQHQGAWVQAWASPSLSLSFVVSALAFVAFSTDEAFGFLVALPVAVGVVAFLFGFLAFLLAFGVVAFAFMLPAFAFGPSVFRAS